MKSDTDIVERDQTLGEEIANAVTHGVGAVLSIACLVVGVVYAALIPSAWAVVSMSIFGSCMFVLYLCSTLYHAVAGQRAKSVLNIFDHSAIYLLIAGSYTPFCLYFMRQTSPGWAWAIFGVVWLLAIVGIVFQSIFINKYRTLSTTTYVLMGWIVLIAIYPLYENMGLDGVLWIGLGGLIYSLGVIFYSLKRIKYMHAIWHIFVLAGTLIHYGLILYKLIEAGNVQI